MNTSAFNTIRDRCLREGLVIFSTDSETFSARFAHHLKKVTELGESVIPKKHMDCWTYCTWPAPRSLHQSLDHFDQFSHPGAVQDLIYQYFSVNEQIELDDTLDTLALFTYVFCLTLEDFTDRQRQLVLHRFLYGVLRTFHSSS